MAHVRIAGKYAMPCEKLRAYCRNATCSLRPENIAAAEEAAEAAATDPNGVVKRHDEDCEIGKDDAEEMDAQAINFEQGEQALNVNIKMRIENDA